MKERPLTFRWLETPQISGSLLMFLALSALAHALAFYLFRVVYPAPVHVRPPPAPVSLLVPGSPGSDLLLRWIEAEDPALESKPQSAPAPGLFALPYSPSYAQARALPKT